MDSIHWTADNDTNIRALWQNALRKKTNRFKRYRDYSISTMRSLEIKVKLRLAIIRRRWINWSLKCNSKKGLLVDNFWTIFFNFSFRAYRKVEQTPFSTSFRESFKARSFSDFIRPISWVSGIYLSIYRMIPPCDHMARREGSLRNSQWEYSHMIFVTWKTESLPEKCPENFIRRTRPATHWASKTGKRAKLALIHCESGFPLSAESSPRWFFFLQGNSLN